MHIQHFFIIINMNHGEWLGHRPIWIHGWSDYQVFAKANFFTHLGNQVFLEESWLCVFISMPCQTSPLLSPWFPEGVRLTSVSEEATVNAGSSPSTPLSFRPTLLVTGDLAVAATHLMWQFCHPPKGTHLCCRSVQNRRCLVVLNVHIRRRQCQTLPCYPF